VTVVIDASVMVKWLLQDLESEPDTDTGHRALLESVVSGATAILQPVHRRDPISRLSRRT
jgi:hypothetical protein